LNRHISVFESVLMLLAKNYQKQFVVVETTAYKNWRVFETRCITIQVVGDISFVIFRGARMCVCCRWQNRGISNVDSTYRNRSVRHSE